MKRHEAEYTEEELYNEEETGRETEGYTGVEVAVIGMDGRFPGSANIEEFWKNLENGKQGISFFTDEELIESGVDLELLEKKGNYVKASGHLEGKEMFDAAFFGYTPAEARVMEPQVRLFHECAWKALEDAGYAPDNREIIGIYAGAASSFGWEALQTVSETSEMVDQFSAEQLKDKDFLSTRISYKMNLKGPAVLVQSACSTSLLAIHLAYRALLGGECDIALAGGVTVRNLGKTGYIYQEGMIYSPDGCCRAFSEDSKGMVPGEGVGVVVLKSLEEAQEDGDHIYAIIKGSAVNNDGLRKIGYAAPSVKGQAEVVYEALQMAEVEPESIGYIETHGTGTPLGDTVEIEALKQAFQTGKKQYCAIGAIKSNIGHLNSAAGVAGFIKTVLTIHNRTLVPSLHYTKPNSKIDFESTPFFVSTRRTEWKSRQYPLRAGISSLGIGGTNVHIVMEEPPPETPSTQQDEWNLILQSAKTGTALNANTKKLTDYLSNNPDVNLTDVSYTLQVGRKPLKYRRVQVCRNVPETVDVLSAAPDTIKTYIAPEEEQFVVFMFSGQGSQYVNMGLELYQKEPLFRDEIDACFKELENLIPEDGKSVLYPDPMVPFNRTQPPDNENMQPKPAGTVSSKPWADIFKEKINQFTYTSPIKFVFEYALTRLLISWGIKPNAMIGHSFGEYVAATLAGVLSREDALKLVALRGKLMDGLPWGAMTSVAISEERINEILKREENKDISLAAVNGPEAVIVSAALEPMNAFEERMTGENIQWTRLRVPRASHSKCMEPILKEFEAEVRSVTLNPPQIPYISGVTGKWITVEDAQDPGYWIRHLRGTVRFSDGLEQLLKEENAVYIQVGSDRSLGNFINEHPSKKEGHHVLNLIRHPKEHQSDVRFLMTKIGQLWATGCNIDWTKFHAEKKRRRLSLPTYTFDSRPYVIQGNPLKMAARMLSEKTKLQKKSDKSEWFYVPAWKRMKHFHKPVDAHGTKRLIFIDDTGLGEELAGMFREQNDTVVTVAKGEQFETPAAETPTGSYIINPHCSADYDSLFKEMESNGFVPDRIHHLWGVTPEPGKLGESQSELQRTKDAQYTGFYSILYQVGAITRQNQTHQIRMDVIVNNQNDVLGGEKVYPEKATVQGAVNVIPQEYPNIQCRTIDIDQPQIHQLYEELRGESTEKLIAYRNHHRWIPEYEPVRLKKEEGTPPMLRKEGVYLITGGLGNIGLYIAGYLAKRVNAKLVLVGRSSFPAKEDWEKWVTQHGEIGILSEKIKKLQDIEKQGGDIIVKTADVANEEQMKDVIQQVEAQYGKINGVLHAAAVTTGKAIQCPIVDIGNEQIEEQFRPKIYGQLVLDKLLADKELDFCIMTSSLSAILGGLGFIHYSAANNYQDRYVHRKQGERRPHWISINLDSWKFDDRAVENSDDSNPFDMFIVPEDGEELLDTIFSVPGVEQLLVSTGDLQLRLNTWATEKKDEETASAMEEEFKIQYSRPDLSKPYAAPRTPLEEAVTGIWSKFFGLDKVGINDIFFELGGDSLKGMKLVNEYQKLLGEIVYITVVFEAPSPSEVAAYFEKHYPETSAKINGVKQQEQEKKTVEKIDASIIDRYRQLVRTNSPRIYTGTEKNPPALFVLSPPRSGSTLLRILLAGHPGLFAPPELTLLSFTMLQEVESGYQSLVRTIMQIKECGVEEAKEILEQYMKQDISTRDFYRQIQQWLGNRMLVDKSPVYAGNIDVLKRAEAEFENPYYIHLVRHPYGTINSFEGARIDLFGGAQLLEKLSLTRKAFAELAWTVCHQNIQDLLEDVPAHRKMQLRFEELLENPREKMEAICRFLKLDFHPDMLQPYKDKQQRMTDGIHKDSMMMGDPKFHQHKRIESNVADQWKKRYKNDFLGSEAVRMAKNYGYTLLNKTKSIENENKTGYAPIQPATEKDYYKLSFAQKRLYILHRMDPEGIGYNIPYAIRLKGKLDPEYFRQTFQLLVDRHESLRTSFVMRQEEPVQEIHTPHEVKCDFIIRETTEAGVKDEIKAMAKPFDLTRPPLFRVGLFKISEQDHVLMLEVHHIIADGTSLNQLVREFMTHFNGKPLPALKIQYKDYSEWQQREAAKGVLKLQEDYWVSRFEGDTPVLKLPTDSPRPTVQVFDGKTITDTIGAADTEALKEMARQKGATLFILLLAIYNIQLSAITGQEDIVVGTPTAGRRHADLDNVIGMFVNTLALRNTPTGEKTFYQFLEQVKATTLAAYDNQDYPFENLVEKVYVSRDTSRNPLFDTMFVYQNFGSAPGETPGEKITELTQEHYANERTIAKFDITFGVREVNGKLEFIIDYSSKLFTEERIKRYAAYFKQLVSTVLKNPEAPIARFEIITEEEKRQIIEEFNGPKTQNPGDKLLHQLFEDQVNKTPENIVYREIGTGTNTTTQITYADLDEKANRLAAKLIQEGVRPDTIVAIQAAPSIEQVIGIIGILKAGAAYLPIDAQNPLERTRYIQADSGVGLHLTGRGVEPLQIENGPKYRQIQRLIEAPPLTPTPKASIKPSNLAYTIYTSGTTGRPKGVLVEHAGVVNTLQVRKDEYKMHEGDTALQLFSYVFDGYVTSFFTPVISGATVIQPGKEEAGDAAFIAKIIKQYDVTHTIAVPTLFRAILEQMAPGSARALKTVTLAGEQLSPELLEKAAEKIPGVEIAHEYGVTEASVMTTIYRHQEMNRRVTVGKPLFNTVVTIRDKYKRYQPVGIPGELYIAGQGVARGYLNNPQLTMEKFIETPGEKRQYKTGDQAQWTREGNIEIHGRQDQQVKVRGYRIELGEIETGLMKHHAIKEAVVTVTADRNLAAYIVTRETVETTRDQLRDDIKAHMSQQYPSYMIPAHFVLMDGLPRNNSGKIDRRQLPSPGETIAMAGQDITPPTNETEERLVEIWEEILERDGESIGINSDFFELGGHSLKATILIARLHKEFNIKLSLADIFKQATIKKIAQRLGETALQRRNRYAAIEKAEPKEKYRLSSAQKRIYLIQRMDPESAGYNMPAYLEVAADIDTKKIENTFRSLIERHESFRTAFVQQERQPMQTIHPEVKFELERYEVRSNEEIPTVMKKFVRPFNLETPPLLRAAILELCSGDKRKILVVDMHHIISDGVSSQVLLDEFRALYEERPLPPLRIQYKDFAEWQESEANESARKAGENYWLERFRGEIPQLELPLDNPRPAVRTFEGNTQRFSLGKKETAKVKAIATEAGGTSFMVLLAVFNVLLSKICGQEDIVVGTPVAGREHADLERVIGMFVNTLALRNRPRGEITFRRFLNEVIEGTLEAFNHQAYQFDELVETLNVKRESGRNPLIDVLFSYQVSGEREETQNENRIPTTEIDIKPIQFDWILTGFENEESIGFTFEYYEKLFKKESIAQYIGYFKDILTEILKDDRIELKDIVVTKDLSMATAIKPELEFNF
jgi:amino acid adenylation domain-containing protein